MKIRKSMFTTATAFLVAGMLQAALASEPFVGTATLCAVDFTGVTAQTEGNNGVEYTYNQVFLYRIDTEEPMMTGWEVLTSNYKKTPSSVAFYFGNTILEPDEYAGTLEEDFKFFETDSGSISGTMRGTGDLDGVKIDYQLVYVGPGQGLPTDACDNIPWEGCGVGDPFVNCVLVPSGVSGYLVSGSVR